jgi:protease-4
MTPLDADMLVDRRRLRRRLMLWRVAAFAIAIVAVLGIGTLVAGRSGMFDLAGGRHVARVAISGFISYDRPLIRALDRVAENDSVRALILQIDSPGGSTTGSEAIYAAIRRVAAKKPVVAVVGTLGASGAYIASLGADHIVSGETSLVGSIGVIVQWAEIDQLLRTLGIRFQEVKTSPLKAAPNPFEPSTEEARAALRMVVGDSYTWFTDLVRTRRNLDADKLREVSDGRVFTGRQSLELRLVDELGDERTARQWLERAKGVPASVPVRDVRPDRDRVPGLIDIALHGIAERVGIPSQWLSQLTSGEPRLDGLVSLWHPAIEIRR